MPDFSFSNIWNQINRNPYAEWDAERDANQGDIELPNPNAPARLIPPKPRTWMDTLQDPTKPIRDYFHNQADDKYGPSDTPLPTDVLGLFSQDFSPEGAAPGHAGSLEAATPLVPRELLKRRAQAIADAAEISFRNKPQLKQVVQDMAEKHPNIVGNLSKITPSKHTNSAAMFWSYGSPWGSETLRNIINDPQAVIQSHPEARVRQVASSMLGTTAEERVKKLSNIGPEGLMPRISIGGAQEEAPIAANYKSMRHELSHATDYIYRPGDEGTFITADKPGYWTSRPEVRARAVERNFGRDMGIMDANKTRAIQMEDFHPDDLAMLSDEDKGIFHELNAARERYGDKVAAEIALGSKQAQRSIVPGKRNRKVSQAADAAIDSYTHFFGPRADGPRLQKPERFDTRGISQGEFKVRDLLGGLFGY